MDFPEQKPSIWGTPIHGNPQKLVLVLLSVSLQHQPSHSVTLRTDRPDCARFGRQIQPFLVAASLWNFEACFLKAKDRPGRLSTSWTDVRGPWTVADGPVLLQDSESCIGVLPKGEWVTASVLILKLPSLLGQVFFFGLEKFEFFLSLIKWLAICKQDICILQRSQETYGNLSVPYRFSPAKIDAFNQATAGLRQLTWHGVNGCHFVGRSNREGEEVEEVERNKKLDLSFRFLIVDMS